LYEALTRAPDDQARARVIQADPFEEHLTVRAYDVWQIEQRMKEELATIKPKASLNTNP